MAFLSVMLGSMALIISLSVLDGFDSKLRENAVKFTAHLTVKSFRQEPIPRYKQIISRLKNKFDKIKSIAPLIEREGLVKSRDYVEGILFRGIKAGMDITGIGSNIIEGTFGFSSLDAMEMVVGKRLADKMGLVLGDDVVAYSIKQGGINSIPDARIRKFKIIGIYRTGMAQYDDIMVYTPFAAAQNFFAIPANSASIIEIMLDDVNDAKSVSPLIEDYLGFPLYCQTVFDFHRAIFAWIEPQKETIPIVLGLISIVAILNIITTLLITVVEKTNSIGILRALGMKNKSILSIFLFQGVAIGAVGTLVGCGIGLALCWLQLEYGIINLRGEIYFLDTLPIKLSFWHYEVVISISILLAFLATLIPSYVAVRMKPLNAIRYK